VSLSWTAIWQLQLQLESENETLSTAVMTNSADKRMQEEKVLTFKECMREYTEEEVGTRW